MKKIILLIFLLFSVVFFGQISGLNQPTVNNKVCDDNNDGFASFSMAAISGEIVGQITPNYLVTHHLSQNDAATGANPLPNTFINTVANTQVVFAKVINITTTLSQIVTYNLIVNPRPAVITYSTNICDNDGTPNGITTTSPLSSFNPYFSINNQFAISYFRTQADAQANTNALIQTTPYTNITPNQEVLFVRVQSSTGCFCVSQLVLMVQSCLVVCTSPTAVSATNLTATSAVLNWVGSSASNQYEVYASAPGTTAPTATTQGVMATTTPFVLGNLNCGTPYVIYVRTVCGNNGNSAWTAPITITTLPCGPVIG